MPSPSSPPPPAAPNLEADPEAAARASYRALREKVDAFAAAVHTRRAADLACRRGCAGCCRVELSLCAVEAAAVRAHLETLPPDEREALRRRAQRPPEAAPRCVMLGDDDACAIYAARPLVCRTQGLPLRYPEDLIPEASVRGRVPGGAVTWCPLNFPAAAERPPAAADVLDAERVDQALALINRAYTTPSGPGRGDPLARTTLRELAAYEKVIR
ncbi:MAG: YkgJ family cysteine cluster protein [Polyangia bacterium]